jgi:hypothetical protein
MRLGVIYAVALVPGTWVLVNCRFVEIVEGLIALGLVVGTVLAFAIGARRRCRAVCRSWN